MKIFILAIILAVILGVVWVSNNEPDAPIRENPRTVVTNTDSENPDQNQTTMGMYAEENALVPQDQKPGNSVTISNVLLDQSGYAVVHEASGDAPGAIIGSSALLEAGEHNRVEIMLERGTRDGETLYVMLHSEQGGDQTFDAAVDMPVQSALGGPIMAMFMIDIEAEAIIDVLP